MSLNPVQQEANDRPNQFTLKGLMIVVTVLAVLCSLCVVVSNTVGTALDRERCYGLFTQVGTAMQGYHETHGCYPPAYIADENGKPMHSWRVLILPQIGRDDLFDRYNFNEPWNGPNNSKLATEIPIVYRCPEFAPRDKTLTTVVAVVGKGTAWPGAETVSQDDFHDGRHNTIHLLELHDLKINWMEPRDVSLEELVEKGLPEAHPGGVNVLMADGSVAFFVSSIDDEVLRAWLMIDERVPADTVEPIGEDEWLDSYLEP